MQPGAPQARQMQQPMGCSASRQVGTFWSGPPSAAEQPDHDMPCHVAQCGLAAVNTSPVTRGAASKSIFSLRVRTCCTECQDHTCDLPPDHGAEEGVQTRAEDTEKAHRWSSKLSSCSFPNRASPPFPRATRHILTLRFTVPFGHSNRLPNQRGGYGAAQEKPLSLLHFSKNEAQHITQMLGLKK